MSHRQNMLSMFRGDAANRERTEKKLDGAKTLPIMLILIPSTFTGTILAQNNTFKTGEGVPIL